MATTDAPLSGVLDDLAEAGGTDTVSIGDIMDAFEQRSLGVLLTMLSLIAALPVIGGIPGMSILTGTLILIAVAQSFLGRHGLWLPGTVRKRQIARRTLDKALAKARPALRRVDTLIRPRLRILSAGRLNHGLIAAAAAVMAVTFYPLAVVPYGVTAPAVGVLALGLGLMGCDGLFVLIGYAFAGVTAYLMWAFM